VRLRRPGDDLESEATVAKAQALSEEELQALLAATAPEWQLLVSFLADTGLRIGEALALQWKHVDLGARRVQVRRRVYEGKFAKPKTRYGVRDVPISSALAQDLWRLRGAAGAEALGDEALVFATADGGLLNPSTVLRAVQSAGKRAGVPWVTVHCLRHTCATRLFRRGVNAKQAQVWLGHHSPAFTLSVYTHLISDDMPDPDDLFAASAGARLTGAMLRRA
jgi:integrase